MPLELKFDKKDKLNFDQLQVGVKTVETRAATDTYKAVQVGDTLTFTCGSDSFSKRVAKVHYWPDITTMLKEVSLTQIMPDLSTEEEMRARYDSYPNYKEKIATLGIVGFEFE